MYQNLGADFCAPKSGYQSQKRPVFSPELFFFIFLKKHSIVNIKINLFFIGPLQQFFLIIICF